MDTVLSWDPTAPNPLVSIPHRQFQSATFFKRDPFHFVEANPLVDIMLHRLLSS